MDVSEDDVKERLTKRLSQNKIYCQLPVECCFNLNTWICLFDQFLHDEYVVSGVVYDEHAFAHLTDLGLFHYNSLDLPWNIDKILATCESYIAP